jgi:hypothetical protein
MGISARKASAHDTRSLFLASLLLAATALAGGDVILIGRSTYVGGGIVTSLPGQHSRGRGEIRLSAPIGGNAPAAGGRITVTGAVKGKTGSRRRRRGRRASRRCRRSRGKL